MSQGVQPGVACLGRAEQGIGNPADVPLTSKFHAAESVTEWRSREDPEPSSNSSSLPSFWDTDEDEEASSLSSVAGPKPSDLYGKFTWKIESFSEISKRELRSNVFEVGGYKWYILVYPQGCDVCNHLSLFLCVADHDKLLPGWSQFAQFTIAVVNKDPKKSKYSDTLHRFCKKEHDWGWKKFMELSKVLDGFTVADTLVIKAQVQVIRENPNRPFRCLDFQYRRELVRVYLTNIEGICRRFMEEKREKLGKLMEDTVRWGSFRSFWLAVEEHTRCHLAQEKADVVFKAIVKRFFNEKEVTSTLVMDALYSGCKALNSRNKCWKGKLDRTNSGQAIDPIVWLDKDVFVLSGDILTLLERAATECLPLYKDDKGPQNRIKEVNSLDETGKDSIERDELRLTDLGRRTIEMFVLAHLFSNRVEVAYREAIALKRQEELIREEEAAGLAESELRAKREAAEKEKRYKKKQAKQRRKDRKEKEKEKESSEKILQVEQPQENHEDISGIRIHEHHISPKDPELSSVNLTETGDDEDDSVVLEASDDMGTSALANEDGDCDRVLWRREGLCPVQTMEASFSGSISDDAKWIASTNRKNTAPLDDSSSTCSSDSLPCSQPSMIVGVGHRPVQVEQNHSLPRRRITTETAPFENGGRFTEVGLHTCSDARGTGEASSSSAATLDLETIVLSLKERIQWLEKRLLEKEEEVVLLQEQLSLLQHKTGFDRNFRSLDSPGKTLDHKTALEGCEAQTQLKLENRSRESTHSSSSNTGDALISGKAGVHKTCLSKPCKSLRPNEQLVRCGSNAEYAQSLGVNGKDTGDRATGVIASKDYSIRPTFFGAKSYESSHHEKTNALFPVGHAPVLAKKSHSESMNADCLNHASSVTCATTNVVPNYSRPSSAPVFANSSVPSTSVSAFDAVPILARSNSAVCGLNGAGESASSINGLALKHNGFVAPVALSYRNATLHNLQASSSIGVVNHALHSVPSPANCSVPSVTPASSDYALSDSPLASFCSTKSAITSSVRPTSASDLLVFDGQSSPRTGSSVGEEAASLRGSNLCNLSNFKEEVANTYAHNNQIEGNQNAVAFTFGTITQEVLHNEHKQQGQPPDSPNTNEQRLQRCERESEQKELQEPRQKHLHENHKHQPQHQHYFEPQSHCHQQYQTPGQCVEQTFQRDSLESGESPLSTVRQATRLLSAVESVNSSAILSEEFPHLDIINELLDEDKNLGKALSALLQYPNGQSFNHQVSLSKSHSFGDAQICSNECSRNGGAIENRRGSLDLLFSQKQSKLNSGSASKNLQHKGSYAHIPLSQFQNVCTSAADGISQYWPLGQGTVPPDGYEISMQNGLTSHAQYPLGHSHRIPAVDCSGVVGYDGFTVFTPLQSP